MEIGIAYLANALVVRYFGPDLKFIRMSQTHSNFTKSLSWCKMYLNTRNLINRKDIKCKLRNNWNFDHLLLLLIGFISWNKHDAFGNNVSQCLLIENLLTCKYLPEKVNVSFK